MAVTRSEFDGGNWRVAQPNNTVDRNWLSALETTQKYNCTGRATFGPITSKGTVDEDVKEIPFKSMCGENWFSVEVRAKGEGQDGPYPAVSLFDRDHNLIVEFDSRLNPKNGPGSVAVGGGGIMDRRVSGDSIFYAAQLSDDSNKTGKMYIELVSNQSYDSDNPNLSYIVIGAGDEWISLWPTSTRLEDPVVNMNNVDVSNNPQTLQPRNLDEARNKEFITGSTFTEHHNIGIKGRW